jgi:hypothetical protein
LTAAQDVTTIKLTRRSTSYPLKFSSCAFVRASPPTRVVLGIVRRSIARARLLGRAVQLSHPTLSSKALASAAQRITVKA